MTHASLPTAAPAASLPLPRVFAVLVVLALPSLIDASAVSEAAALWELGRAASPYWQPAHGVLLYVRAPIAAASAVVLVLLPGLLIAAASGRRGSMGDWVMRGVAWSLLLLTVATEFIEGVAGTALTGRSFGVAVLVALLPGVMALRSRRLGGIPFGEGDSGVWFGASLFVPACLLVAFLAPKFFWESFNGDGAHAFESTRLLLTQPVPFWSADAGPVAAFPGLTTMLFTFPGSWFVRLFGPVEASVRLPLLLSLVLLVVVIGEFVRHGAEDQRPSHVVIWLTLGGYLLALAFSATYNPYSADLALPATQDTLLMGCFLAFALSFVRENTRWLTVWGVLCYLSLPSGLILLGMWMVATAIVTRPVPWRMIRATLLTLLGCMIGGAVVSRILPLAGLPAPGGEYGLVGILRYFAFLQITDWHRLLYIAVPAGILPVLATFVWRRQDAASRALTLVTWAYFAFFFVQANVSLHHFVPSMILPLVVFWRMLPATGPRARVMLAMACAVLGIALSWPSRWAPSLTGRDIGERIVETVGGYADSDARELRASTLLSELFPPDWDPSVPDESYGGSPLVWNHYARHGGAVAEGVDYVLATASAAPPAGWQLHRRDEAASLFIRDSAVLMRDRAMRPPIEPGAPLLRVPRWVLFRSVPARGGPRALDVAEALERAGVDLDPLLRRLGVRR